jgi:Tol biopolymer transport system component
MMGQNQARITKVDARKFRHSILNRQRLTLSRFDTVVMSIIGLLVIAILATVALADVTKPGPRVAYVAPADAAVHNIWIADPNKPDSAQQLTFSQDGIYDFDVSADGRYVAFSERNNNTSTTELKLLDLNTGSLQQLTDCISVNADCKTPRWRPDGKMIAYERTDLNNQNGGITGSSPIRVWLLDLSTNPTSTHPLFNDSQILGYEPQWSGDGSEIAVFDDSSGGVLIYNFQTGSVSKIPNQYGSVGTLSPDGTRLVFPEMTRIGNQMIAHLKIADLASRVFKDLTSADDPVDDIMPAWNPDGKRVAIARQYMDNRWTQGHQVYLLTPDDGSLEPLVVDEHYQSASFVWDSAGKELLMQRFPVLTETGEQNDDGRPEIWTYDLTTKKLTKIADNAFQPHWIPAQ